MDIRDIQRQGGDDHPGAPPVAPPIPSEDVAPLESILFTEELDRRPSRAPDYEKENRALTDLAQALADSPRTILQTLSDTILWVLDADSAGVSLLTDDETRFYWPAIAGAWQAHIGGGTPRDFGPCGDVLDRNAPLLFRHVERRYTYFVPATPPVEECLLVPFSVGGRPVGTIWAIFHSARRHFDREDLRQLVSLGRFASSAYQAVRSREKVEQGDQHKNEFLAMLAHELRNPLAPIVNALQVLDHADADPAQATHARQLIGRQVRQIVRLVDDLLDVSRISRGKIVLRREIVSLARVIEEATEAARVLCSAREITLTVTMPASELYVSGDPARLTQVVGNLLNNACKFTEPRGCVFLVVERVGDEVYIRVRDTGIGIDPEQVGRIFEMFVQGDTSLERNEAGLGIGLTLVKTLVELHAGSVSVRSAGLGHGSEFVVLLPIVDRAATSAPGLQNGSASSREPEAMPLPEVSGHWRGFESRDGAS